MTIIIIMTAKNVILLSAQSQQQTKYHGLVSFLALFEYLCYGSTTVIKILITLVRGSSLYVRILMYKDCPCAERVNPQSAEIPSYKPWRPKGFIRFKIITYVFSFYLNTYVMCQRPLKKNVLLQCGGIVFSHQNLTSTDIKF